MFFILWTWFILDISIDAVLWNALYIVINIVYAIPLIKDKMRVKLLDVTKPVYEEVFSNVLSRAEFKFLFSYAKLKTITTSDTQFVHQGNPFEELILIDEVPRTKQVVIKKDGHNCIEMCQYGWVGMMEAVLFMKNETKVGRYNR